MRRAGAVVGRITPAWSRQSTPKSGGYVSPMKHKAIWNDKVTRAHRDPVSADARRVGTKHARDCFGNRVCPESWEQAARTQLQRLSAYDAEFGRRWAAMTPKEANDLVGVLADDLRQSAIARRD